MLIYVVHSVHDNIIGPMEQNSLIAFSLHFHRLKNTHAELLVHQLQLSLVVKHFLHVFPRQAVREFRVRLFYSGCLGLCESNAVKLPQGSPV